ncbi:MAG: hypothetical protein MJE12_11830 [Alphaproteobacteria bacterium]|nr:hypothetical protein [Alphaproteobacteria bacterium]
MYYVKGQAFDALAEFINVGASTMSSDTAESWASLLGSLCEIEDFGFTKAKPAWQQTGQHEIWLFQDRDVWMALRVPGDGRANTFDVVLLKTSITSNPSVSTSTLLQSAKNRLQNGKEIKWV